ncbi:MAG: hypothetical protein C5B47_07205 [Verrucomicrobia bacterium]|nr:MAG: hypothetical protein C5B47_07205 [Verrucomicrobiota bacterium]
MAGSPPSTAGAAAFPLSPPPSLVGESSKPRFNIPPAHPSVQVRGPLGASSQPLEGGASSDLSLPPFSIKESCKKIAPGFYHFQPQPNQFIPSSLPTSSSSSNDVSSEILQTIRNAAEEIAIKEVSQEIAQEAAKKIAARKAAAKKATNNKALVKEVSKLKATPKSTFYVASPMSELSPPQEKKPLDNPSLKKVPIPNIPNTPETRCQTDAESLASKKTIEKSNQELQTAYASKAFESPTTSNEANRGTVYDPVWDLEETLAKLEQQYQAVCGNNAPEIPHTSKNHLLAEEDNSKYIPQVNPIYAPNLKKTAMLSAEELLQKAPPPPQKEKEKVMEWYKY